MNTIVLGLMLGAAAGILDVIPMLMQKLPWNANVSAFCQWVFLGLVIANCNLGLPGWLTGLIIGVAGAIPVILITAASDPRTAIPIFVMSAVLGALVGFASRISFR
jgi:hypothetical protein